MSSERMKPDQQRRLFVPRRLADKEKRRRIPGSLGARYVEFWKDFRYRFSVPAARSVYGGVAEARDASMRKTSNETEPAIGIPTAEPSSPRFALRLLLPRKTRQAIIGDLIEEFRQVCRESSPRKARFFFWCQAIREIARSVLITFLKLSGFATASEALRRYIGN